MKIYFKCTLCGWKSYAYDDDKDNKQVLLNSLTHIQIAHSEEFYGSQKPITFLESCSIMEESGASDHDAPDRGS